MSKFGILTTDETGYTSSEDDNSRSGHYQAIKHVKKVPKMPAHNHRPGVVGAGIPVGQVRSPLDTSDNSLIPSMHYTQGI